MDRKLIINLCVFSLLICFTAIVGSTIEPPVISEERAELMSEEEIAEEHEKGLLARRYFTMAPMILVIVVYGAILFATYMLPSIVHRATHTIYDSGEMVEEDPLHDARSLFAQGDYEGAIEEYRTFAQDHQGDRFPWVEIAKMQNVHLEDPDASIAIVIAATVWPS